MCQEFNELPTERFTGAPRGTFYIKLSVNNITSKDDLHTWLQWFTTSSNIKYNVQGGLKWKGVKVIYVQWFICQCKRKKLTKKLKLTSCRERGSSSKKRKETYGTQKGNSGKEQCNLHLLSKAREKKTNNSEIKVSVKIFTNNQINHLCEIQLWWNHNHRVQCFHSTSFCQILSTTTDKFSHCFD